MAEIDLSKLKPGDGVLVRGIFAGVDDEGDCKVRCTLTNGEPSLVWCAPSEIVSVEPRQLAVGDRVRWGDWVGRLDYTGKSLGVLTTEPNGIEKVVDLRDLERAT